MKDFLLQHLVCPDDQQPLLLKHEQRDDKGEILEGKLVCEKCGQSYPIHNSIPRFVPKEHYANSFGFQWNRFAKTQLDSHSGLPISKDRFFQVTKWPKKFEKESLCLEIGCGSGRFSEIALSTGCQLISVDASTAVDANLKNHPNADNLHLVQADLRRFPFRRAYFDRVICLGVIQHTPDPEESFFHIAKMPKKDGGELTFDIYSKTASTWMWTKYWLLPFTSKLPPEKLLKFLEKILPFLLRTHDVVRLIPFFGRFLAYRLVPVATYKYSYNLSREQHFEWSLLDTFDMLSPAHDHPKSLNEIRQWLDRTEAEKLFCDYGPNGIVGRLRF